MLAEEHMEGVDIPMDELGKLWLVVNPLSEVSVYDTLGGNQPPSDLLKAEHLTVAILGDGEHTWFVGGERVATVVWGVGYCEVELAEGTKSDDWDKLADEDKE